MLHTIILIICLMCPTLQGLKTKNSNRCGKRCCVNYMEQGGLCIECVGMYGLNCSTPCPKNSFGPSCRHRCYCEERNGCHPLTGCCFTESGICEGNGQNQEDNTTEAHIDDAIPLYTILLPVGVTILVVTGAISVYVWIRQERRINHNVRDVPITAARNCIVV